jgi:hypothetical protein
MRSAARRTGSSPSVLSEPLADLSMTATPSLELLENAFLPAREMVDPARFAGRRDQIEQAYLTLISEGTNVAIVGSRGVGKSSLARQVGRIATGSVDLLEKHGIPTSRKLDFLTLYLACGREIRSTEHLLERLLWSHDCLASWVYDIPQARRSMENYSPKFEAKIFGVGVELGGAKETETTAAPAAPTHDAGAVFTNVVSAIAKQNLAPDGILIIIDEFDQIVDRRGFASLLKALATNVPKVKFCVVGVAHNLHELIEEHQSADRLFAGGIVALPAMTNSELTEVIDAAELYIENAIVFHVEAKKRLTTLAQGHPYMVHLVGKHALRGARKNARIVIEPDDIDDTLRLIAESGADPILEARYMKAIASSPQREAVLRAMVQCEKGGEVWTTDAYKLALEVGVENPSQYVGHLVSEEYGAELIKVRERYYRFADSLFRAYLCARPQQYATEVGYPVHRPRPSARDRELSDLAA